MIYFNKVIWYPLDFFSQNNTAHEIKGFKGRM
jgi:hypothetical protein